MKLTERLLKKLVMEQMNEAPSAKPEKAGTAGAEGVQGNVDLNKVAATLGLDATLLKTAVTALKKNQRKSSYDKVFGDLFAKLMTANDQDVILVMNTIKKFEQD